MAKQTVDPELVAATDLARSALLEIAKNEHIGSLLGHEADESGAVTLFFESKLPGYPGWRWAASLAKASEDAQPTVLEVEMLPGEGALLSPEWVPWSVRLAQYRESQAALEAERRAALEAAAELGDTEIELDDVLDEDLDDVLDEDDVLDFDDDELDVDLDETDLDDDDEDDDDEDDDDDLDEDDILVNDFSDFDDEIDGVDIDSLDIEQIVLDGTASDEPDDGDESDDRDN